MMEGGFKGEGRERSDGRRRRKTGELGRGVGSGKLKIVVLLFSDRYLAHIDILSHSTSHTR
jgi:hypothetical protein